MNDLADRPGATRLAAPAQPLPVVPALTGAIARIGPFLAALACGLSAGLGYTT